MLYFELCSIGGLLKAPAHWRIERVRVRERDKKSHRCLHAHIENPEEADKPHEPSRLWSDVLTSAHSIPFMDILTSLEASQGYGLSIKAPL